MASLVSISEPFSPKEPETEAGGGRGIRTPGTVSRTSVFKTDCFNHSHIPPREGWALATPLVYNTLPRDCMLLQSKCARVEFHNLGEVRHEIAVAVVAGVQMIFVFDVFSIKLSV